MTCTCPTCGQDIPASAEVRFDHANGVLVSNGVTAYLCPREADFFEVLLRKAPNYIRSDAVLSAVYGAGEHPESIGIVQVYVWKINKRLRGTGLHIEGAKSRGYRVAFREAP